jgi:hypothetical protein
MSIAAANAETASKTMAMIRIATSSLLVIEPAHDAAAKACWNAATRRHNSGAGRLSKIFGSPQDQRGNLVIINVNILPIAERNNFWEMEERNAPTTSLWPSDDRLRAKAPLARSASAQVR